METLLVKDYYTHNIHYYNVEELKKAADIWETLNEEEYQSLSTHFDLDQETFAEYITGMTCDTYSDMCVDSIKDFYEEGDKFEDIWHCLEQDEFFETCYSMWRIWNMNMLSEEEARREWRIIQESQFTYMVESGTM